VKGGGSPNGSFDRDFWPDTNRDGKAPPACSGRGGFCRVPEGWAFALLDDTEFGAAIERPGLFVACRVCGHLAAEADCLDAVDLNAGVDEGLADGLGTTFTEAAVVFLSAAFVGESGDDETIGRGVFEGGDDLLEFRLLGGFDPVAVVAEEDGCELAFGDALAKKIRASFEALT